VFPNPSTGVGKSLPGPPRFPPGKFSSTFLVTPLLLRRIPRGFLKNLKPPLNKVLESPSEKVNPGKVLEMMKISQRLAWTPNNYRNAL